MSYRIHFSHHSGHFASSLVIEHGENSRCCVSVFSQRICFLSRVRDVAALRAPFSPFLVKGLPLAEEPVATRREFVAVPSKLLCLSCGLQNACDGIDGALKRSATVQNLRSTSAVVIQTTHDFACKLAPKCPNIVLLYVPQNDASEQRSRKLDEWKPAQRIPSLKRKTTVVRSSSQPD